MQKIRPTFVRLFSTFIISLLLLAGLQPLYKQIARAQSTGCNSDTYIETTQILPVNSNYAMHMYARGGQDAKAYVSVDNSNCLIYSVSSGDWSWVSADSNAVFEDVTADEHTIRIYFDGDQLDVDRVVFTSDTACDPADSSVSCIESTPSLNIEGVAQGDLVTEDRRVFASITNSEGANTEVTFYLDENEVRRVGDEPYCMYEGSNNTCGTLKISSLDEGEHTIKALLSQGGEQVVEKVVNFSVSKPDTTDPGTETELIDPQVQLEGLKEGSTISDKVTISVNLTNVSKSAIVRFRIDDKSMNTSSKKPYCMNGSANGVCKEWDSKSLKNGSYTLYATISGSGIKSKVMSYDFKINNKAPIVINTGSSTPTIPIDGQPATTTGTVKFSAPPTTTPTRQTVTYAVDNKPVETTTKSATATVDTTKLSNGTHTVTASVASVNGEKKTYQSTIDVNNGKLVSSKSWMQRNKALAFMLFLLLACVLFVGIVLVYRFVQNRKLEQEHNIYNSYQYVQPQEMSTYQQAGIAVFFAMIIGLVPLMSRGTSFASGGRGFIEETELMALIDPNDQLSVGFDNESNISFVRFGVNSTPTPT
ncbi:MAG TPA: hypothetical protein PKD20_02435, partial [Candidatus Saccharibacteria bacterium]|nr:hypothetical protein [Candidatus Saccharibacteria bacterium]